MKNESTTEQPSIGLMELMYQRRSESREFGLPEKVLLIFATVLNSILIGLILELKSTSSLKTQLRPLTKFEMGTTMSDSSVSTPRDEPTLPELIGDPCKTLVVRTYAPRRCE